MVIINATRAGEKLYQLISDVNTNSEPVTIVNSRGENAVLVSEEDWKSIQETIYLNNIPGFVESVLASKNEPIDECRQYNVDEEW